MDELVEDESLPLECDPVLPIKVLEPSDEDMVLAGYVCGPIDGELSLEAELEGLFDEEPEEELDRESELEGIALLPELPEPPELPEGTEELPSGSLSEDGCELC